MYERRCRRSGDSGFEDSRVPARQLSKRDQSLWGNTNGSFVEGAGRLNAAVVVAARNRGWDTSRGGAVFGRGNTPERQCGGLRDAQRRQDDERRTTSRLTARKKIAVRLGEGRWREGGVREGEVRRGKSRSNQSQSGLRWISGCCRRQPSPSTSPATYCGERSWRLPARSYQRSQALCACRVASMCAHSVRHPVSVGFSADKPVRSLTSYCLTTTGSAHAHVPPLLVASSFAFLCLFFQMSSLSPTKILESP